VAGVVEAALLAGDGEGLAGAASGPALEVVGDACEAEGALPARKSCEEMHTAESPQIVPCHVDD
jgi:hypothetical protein